MNKLIEGTKYEEYNSLEELVKDKRIAPGTKLGNNALQAFNHSLFWENLTSTENSGEPNDKLLSTIVDEWNDFDSFKKHFEEVASKGFGSTWCWLVRQNGKLKILTTENADNPLHSSKGDILLVVDGWEHSWLYDPQYAADKSKYLNKIWNIIDWSVVVSRLWDSEAKDKK